MVSKPILLLLAFLVACAVAQTKQEIRDQRMKEGKYKRFLSNGVDKKYVDQMREIDILYDDEMAESKNDREKEKKAVKNLKKGFEDMEKKMPKDQVEKYHKSLRYY
ncbi:unnamed protein product [Caenorhabditis brenneri]